MTNSPTPLAGATPVISPINRIKRLVMLNSILVLVIGAVLFANQTINQKSGQALTQNNTVTTDSAFNNNANSNPFLTNQASQNPVISQHQADPNLNGLPYVSSDGLKQSQQAHQQAQVTLAVAHKQPRIQARSSR